MGTNRKQHYSGEYKQDAVNYVMTSGKSIEEAAKDLKIAKSTLSKWIRNAKENARLKKELRDAKDAIEILKKAMSILND